MSDGGERRGAQRRTTLRPGWRDEPAAGRIGSSHPVRSEMLARHAAAMQRRLPTYLDPVTGLSVFTAAFLAGRGECCDSACRHCPFLQE